MRVRLNVGVGEGGLIWMTLGRYALYRDGVGERVGVGVRVSVAVGVAVEVCVGICVAVPVALGVAVRVGLAVVVGVGLAVAVSVGVGNGCNGKLRAGLARNALTSTGNVLFWYPTALASSVTDTHWLR